MNRTSAKALFGDFGVDFLVDLEWTGFGAEYGKGRRIGITQAAFTPAGFNTQNKAVNAYTNIFLDPVRRLVGGKSSVPQFFADIMDMQNPAGFTLGMHIRDDTEQGLAKSIIGKTLTAVSKGNELTALSAEKDIIDKFLGALQNKQSVGGWNINADIDAMSQVATSLGMSDKFDKVVSKGWAQGKINNLSDDAQRFVYENFMSGELEMWHRKTTDRLPFMDAQAMAENHELMQKLDYKKQLPDKVAQTMMQHEGFTKLRDIISEMKKKGLRSELMTFGGFKKHFGYGASQKLQPYLQGIETPSLRFMAGWGLETWAMTLGEKKVQQEVQTIAKTLGYTTGRSFTQHNPAWDNIFAGMVNSLTRLEREHGREVFVKTLHERYGITDWQDFKKRFNRAQQVSAWSKHIKYWTRQHYNPTNAKVLSNIINPEDMQEFVSGELGMHGYEGNMLQTRGQGHAKGFLQNSLKKNVTTAWGEVVDKARAVYKKYPKLSIGLGIGAAFLMLDTLIPSKHDYDRYRPHNSPYTIDSPHGYLEGIRYPISQWDTAMSGIKTPGMPTGARVYGSGRKALKNLLLGEAIFGTLGPRLYDVPAKPVIEPFRVIHALTPQQGIFKLEAEQVIRRQNLQRGLMREAMHVNLSEMATGNFAITRQYYDALQAMPKGPITKILPKAPRHSIYTAYSPLIKRLSTPNYVPGHKPVQPYAVYERHSMSTPLGDGALTRHGRGIIKMTHQRVPYEGVNPLVSIPSPTLLKDKTIRFNPFMDGIPNELGMPNKYAFQEMKMNASMLGSGKMKHPRQSYYMMSRMPSMKQNLYRAHERAMGIARQQRSSAFLNDVPLVGQPVPVLQSYLPALGNGESILEGIRTPNSVYGFQGIRSAQVIGPEGGRWFSSSSSNEDKVYRAYFGQSKTEYELFGPVEKIDKKRLQMLATKYSDVSIEKYAKQVAGKNKHKYKAMVNKLHKARRSILYQSRRTPPEVKFLQKLEARVEKDKLLVEDVERIMKEKGYRTPAEIAHEASKKRNVAAAYRYDSFKAEMHDLEQKLGFDASKLDDAAKKRFTNAIKKYSKAIRESTHLNVMLSNPDDWSPEMKKMCDKLGMSAKQFQNWLINLHGKEARRARALETGIKYMVRQDTISRGKKAKGEHLGGWWRANRATFGLHYNKAQYWAMHKDIVKRGIDPDLAHHVLQEHGMHPVPENVVQKELQKHNTQTLRTSINKYGTVGGHLSHRIGGAARYFSGRGTGFWGTYLSQAKNEFMGFFQTFGRIWKADIPTMDKVFASMGFALGPSGARPTYVSAAALKMNPGMLNDYAELDGKVGSSPSGVFGRAAQWKNEIGRRTREWGDKILKSRARANSGFFKRGTAYTASFSGRALQRVGVNLISVFGAMSAYQSALAADTYGSYAGGLATELVGFGAGSLGFSLGYSVVGNPLGSALVAKQGVTMMPGTKVAGKSIGFLARGAPMLGGMLAGGFINALVQDLIRSVGYKMFGRKPNEMPPGQLMPFRHDYWNANIIASASGTDGNDFGALEVGGMNMTPFGSGFDANKVAALHKPKTVAPMPMKTVVHPDTSGMSIKMWNNRTGHHTKYRNYAMVSANSSRVDRGFAS